MILEHKHYEEIEHKVYKYRVIESFTTKVRIKGYEIDHKFFRLYPGGSLTIKRGYCCDGASGPTLDDDTNMQGGFIHDVLYQMLRLGKLAIKKKDFDRNRTLADLSFRDQLKADGMGRFRRNYYYWGVRMFGKKHALPG